MQLFKASDKLGLRYSRIASSIVISNIGECSRWTVGANRAIDGITRSQHKLAFKAIVAAAGLFIYHSPPLVCWALCSQCQRNDEQYLKAYNVMK